VNSLSRIPPSLAEPPLRRKPALSLRLYEFLRRAVKTKSQRVSVAFCELGGILSAQPEAPTRFFPFRNTVDNCDHFA